MLELCYACRGDGLPHVSSRPTTYILYAHSADFFLRLACENLEVIPDRRWPRFLDKAPPARCSASDWGSSCGPSCPLNKIPAWLADPVAPLGVRCRPTDDALKGLDRWQSDLRGHVECSVATPVSRCFRAGPTAPRWQPSASHTASVVACLSTSWAPK